jgi:hypothetical protein
MPGDPTQRWPYFALVTFSTPTGIPHGWDAELLSKGAPKGLLGRYTALNALTLVEAPGYGPLVRFGATMGTNSVCLDPHTGRIVELMYVPTATIHLPSGVHGLPGSVNSSLNQFIDSVRATFERFPFDGGVGTDSDRLYSELDQAVHDLTDILRGIDTPALADESTFWRTFLDDVQMGNFLTEDIMNQRQA